MIADLANYDLIDLVLGEDWDEEQQAEFVVSFSTLMSKYIGDKLADQLPESLDQEFESLLSSIDLTPEEVLTFYKTKVPDLQEQIDSLMLEFKKLFLTKYYAKEVESLKANSNASSSTLVPYWETIVSSAEKDDWETVWNTLSTIRDQELDAAISSSSIVN